MSLELRRTETHALILDKIKKTRFLKPLTPFVASAGVAKPGAHRSGQSNAQDLRKGLRNPVG